MNTCISITVLWEADTGFLTLSDTYDPVSPSRPSAVGYYSAQRPVIVERGLGGERIIRRGGGGGLRVGREIGKRSKRYCAVVMAAKRRAADSAVLFYFFPLPTPITCCVCIASEIVLKYLVLETELYGCK
jgi:hypothetical protein